jgi:anti-sigma regulatory factor (Ser/Thr protein kinase)
MMQLNLVLEEWVVNVVSYAFEDEQVHEIELRLWQTEKKIIIEISDDGIAFDPTGKAAPDLTVPIEQRAIGGLGIHFIRKTMNEFTYHRQDGKNVITMTKNI